MSSPAGAEGCSGSFGSSCCPSVAQPPCSGCPAFASSVRSVEGESIAASSAACSVQGVQYVFFHDDQLISSAVLIYIVDLVAD